MGVRPETVTVLFTDVVGSTSWRVRVGGRTADEEAAELERATREVVASSGGTVVKSLGDGVMATFMSARLALDAAVALQGVARRLAIGGARDGLRIGISSGDMVREGADWVGTAAIEASRLCAEASGGAVLVADATVRLSRGGSDHALRLLGERLLRGFSEPVDVYELVVRGGAERSLPPVIDQAAGSPIVGREVELSRGGEVLDDVAAGGSHALCIVGEPGVGKTRLVAAIAVDARARGFTVLYGQCSEGLAAPYEPLVDAFGPWLDECPVAALRRIVGPGIREVVQLWPSLASRIPPEIAADEIEPESRRWRLFEAFVGLIRGITAERPLLLVLDDLQWAEPSTRLALSHLVTRRSPGCAVVATARRGETGPQRAAMLDEFDSDGAVEVLALSGLERSGVSELLALHTGDRPPEVLCELLRQATAGNPLFLSALLSHLESVAHVRRDDGVWMSADELVAAGIPTGVTTVITRRLTQLSDDVRGALDVAAVIGSSFDERTVRGVSSAGIDRTAEVIDAAIHAGLVRETDTGHYEFVHALVRQTVLDGLSRTRRARLHWRVAEQLELEHGQRVGEIAYHYAAGSAVGDPATVVRTALAAADGAFAGVAFEEAAAHARTALGALDRMGSDPRLRFRALRGLGMSLNAIGDEEGSGRTWLEAADVARELGDPEALFDTVVGYGYLVRPGHDGDLVRLLDDSLDLIDPGDSPLRACALGWRAVPAFPGENSRPSRGDRDMVETAVAMARRTGDQVALAETLTSRLLLTSYYPDAGEMLRDVEEFLSLGPTVGVLGVGRDKTFMLRQRATALLRLGRVSEAEAAVADAGREAAQNGLRTAMTGVRQLEASLAAARGRFAEAEGIAADGLEAAGQDHTFEQLVYSAHILATRMEQGRLAEVIGSLRAINDVGGGLPGWSAMLANALADAGRGEEATRLLEQLIDDEPFGFAADFASALSIRHLTETCRHLGDASRAAKLLPHIEPWAEQLLVVVYVSTVEAASDRCAGHLLATLGRYDEADAAYSRASALERSAELLPLLARTEYWHARALYEREAPGDGERGRALLDEAVEIADRIGMQLLAAQARAWRESPLNQRA